MHELPENLSWITIKGKNPILLQSRCWYYPNTTPSHCMHHSTCCFQSCVVLCSMCMWCSITWHRQTSKQVSQLDTHQVGHGLWPCRPRPTFSYVCFSTHSLHNIALINIGTNYIVRLWAMLLTTCPSWHKSKCDCIRWSLDGVVVLKNNTLGVFKELAV